jgi:hypothetical protein
MIDAPAQAWRRFVASFAVGFVVLLAIVFAAIVLIDPYDTGYFPSPLGPGVVDDNDVTGTVGRGRDPRFDAAIFGNSHGLLLDPARLSPATGLHFVQLTTLGSGPREQMTLVRYFLRRHADASAIVLAADQTWCMHDPALTNPLTPSSYRFPDWLFGESRVHYLANMLSPRPFGLVRRRILLAMGRLAPIDPAGVAAYPANWGGAPPDAIRARGDPLNGSATQVSTAFPAIDRLETLLVAVPDHVGVVVAMPPLYSGLLPDPDTRQAVELTACKVRLARAVAGPRGAFLDFLVDSALSRDRANFLDLHHMREPVARAMEAQIAAALNGSH